MCQGSMCGGPKAGKKATEAATATPVGTKKLGEGQEGEARGDSQQEFSSVVEIDKRAETWKITGGGRPGEGKGQITRHVT